MSIPIESHYNRPGLYERILDILLSKGLEKGKITREDLSAVDEFHVRGAQVTVELADLLNVSNTDEILDVGCGIGGPARMLASRFQCHVTGIDITSENIRTANLLSELIGLDVYTSFIVADALSLPFSENTFDLVWTQHAQMNIRDKQQFYSEIFRVLKPGGRFIYYDIFKGGETSLTFPVPWANDPSLSSLIGLDQFHKALNGLGMERVSTADQTLQGIHFFETVFEKVRKEGQPAMGIHLLMEGDAKEKLGNVLLNLKEGNIVLESGIFRKIL